MRIRTQLIIEDSVLAKIDEIAGEKHRRAIIIDKALREYIAREEKKPKAVTEDAVVAAAKKGK